MRHRDFATLALLSTLLGCAATNAPAPPREPSTVKVDVGDTVRLRHHDRAYVAGTPYVIRFEHVVEDSRCPSDVVCFWGGRVRIELAFTGGVEPARDTVSLPAFPGGRETATYGAIVVRFVAYEPTPAPPHDVPRPPEDAVAILTIENVDGQ